MGWLFEILASLFGDVLLGGLAFWGSRDGDWSILRLVVAFFVFLALLFLLYWYLA